MIEERDLHPVARSALGSVRLEGGEPDAHAIELADRVARDEVSADEAVAEVLSSVGIVAPAR